MQQLGYVLLAALFLIPAAALSETKIGFVNIAKLMEDAPQVKSATRKMEGEFAPREKELVALQKEVKTLEDKLARDGAMMSESQRGKKERDILSKKRELKRAQDEFREDLNIRRNEEMSKLQKKLFDAVVAVAKEQKFDLIVETAVYASDKVDVTDQVLKRLSK
jgi:outer membrane protein